MRNNELIVSYTKNGISKNATFLCPDGHKINDIIFGNYPLTTCN